MNARTSQYALLGMIATILATAPAAPAQTVSGTVEGTIQDSQGGRIPGVNIELHSTETGQVRTTVTNAQGSCIA